MEVMKLVIKTGEKEWRFVIEIYDKEILHTAYGEEPKPIITTYRVAYNVSFDLAVKQMIEIASKWVREEIKGTNETYTVIIKPQHLGFNIKTVKR